MGVLALLSLAPSSSKVVRTSSVRLQKLMHVGLYAVLAALLIWTLRQAGFTSPGIFPVAWLLATGIGGLMELSQRGRAGRVGSWIDVVRNAGGAAIGTLVFALVISESA